MQINYQNFKGTKKIDEVLNGFQIAFIKMENLEHRNYRFNKGQKDLIQKDSSENQRMTFINLEMKKKIHQNTFESKIIF